MTIEAVKNDVAIPETAGEPFEHKDTLGVHFAGKDTQGADAGKSHATRRKILICDTQPVAVEGMKWLIENSGDLRFVGAVSTLDAVYEMLHPGTALVVEHLTALAARSSEVGGPSAQVSEWEVPEVQIVAGDAPHADHLVTIDDATGVSGDSPALELMDVPGSAPAPIDALVIDKGLGMAEVMAFLQKLALAPRPVPTVVWGAISEAEALRLLQAGARGIMRRTSESGTLLTCLRAVTAGGTWMEDGIFGSTDKIFNPRRSQLTPRESEVVVLVEKGLRNRDIARMLGIQTGTVKIHLKHIFEKTGVRGRYGLALTGLRDRGALAPKSQFGA